MVVQDEEEKKLWHNHVYEVKSGQLYLPGIPQSVQNVDAAKLINTYGKTWHLWQVDRGHELPIGESIVVYGCGRHDA